MVNNSNFWIGSNQFSNDEDTVGAGGTVGLNISGNDWLGIGALSSSLSKGTEECGAKPMCIPTKNNSCAKSKSAYADCIARSQSNKAVAQEKAGKTKSTTLILVISLVAIAIVITGIYLFKKKK